MADILYLKAKQNVEVTSDTVYVRDIASLTCVNPGIAAKVRAMPVHRFRPGQERRAVVGITKVIEDIGRLAPSLTVESLGETDTVIEQVRNPKRKGISVYARIVFVACISFFGTAFTLMAFYNDIGIQDVFSSFYRMVTGRASDGFTVLEVCYSVGLAAGILVFYNHIGGRRITKDPTPIEVAMREYEKQVNETLIQTADREGKEREA